MNEHRGPLASAASTSSSERKLGFPVLLLSGCHGQGSGAERVLEYLLSSGREALAANLQVAAPEGSSVLNAARAYGYATSVWKSRTRSSFQQDLSAFFKFRIPGKQTLIHAWHGRGFEWAALLGKLHGLPVTGTLHDHPEAVGYSALRHKLMRWGAHQMRGLVCVSQAQADACAKLRWTTPLRVIRNGIPPAPETMEIRTARLPFRVAFLGCAEAWKGFDVLQEVAGKLNAGHYIWNAYGPIRSSSSQALRDNSFSSPPIYYRGLQPPEVIYSENDIVFLPSIRFDPFPTVLLEAARAGLPVVAARVGGTPEIVVHGKTGILFEAGNASEAAEAIELLRSDSAAFSRMSLASLEHFQTHFQVSQMVEEYIDFWNTTIPNASFH